MLVPHARPPDLVQAIDVFVQDGFLFLVMELVTGVTLTKQMAKGPLPARRALVIHAAAPRRYRPRTRLRASCIAISSPTT